jgi:hypothetical protein
MRNYGRAADGITVANQLTLSQKYYPRLSGWVQYNCFLKDQALESEECHVKKTPWTLLASGMAVARSQERMRNFWNLE